MGNANFTFNFLGGSFFFTEIALRDFQPFTVIFLRVTLAAWILVGVVYISGQRMPGSLSWFSRRLYNMHYSEIASAIGHPRATRAVARACATNSVAIVIPCHCVVPKTGGVGGYRWGSERKKKLLAIEEKRVTF